MLEIPILRNHVDILVCVSPVPLPYTTKPSNKVAPGHILEISFMIRPSPPPSCVQNDTMIFSEKSLSDIKEGFDVDQFDPNKGMEGMMTPYAAVTDKYDLIVYLCNMATKSNQTTVRIEWAQPMGANVPIYMTKVPTIFISVENPYHLLDVPRVRTFINTYNSTDVVLDALLDKLTGRSEFKGKSPVDAFCGMWDTKLS